MAYCMALVLMFLKVLRMDGIGSLNLSSSSFIDGMCVAALAPTVITMSGFNVIYMICGSQGLLAIYSHPFSCSGEC